MKYLLMHKRTSVLELDIDKLGMIAKLGAVSAPEHLPVGVRTIKSGVDRASFNEWWADRCIPASRSGVRDALQALGVAVPQQLLSRSYGLSLSDHYWLSVMLALGIPDKYAMERGGWSTPNTLKNVYQHTFTEERHLVDEKIDGFFNDILSNS